MNFENRRAGLRRLARLVGESVFRFMSFVENLNPFISQPAHNLTGAPVTVFRFGDQRFVSAENDAFAEQDVLFGREFID